MWGVLLQRYNNTDDVVFGAIVSGRPPEIEDIEQMVGLFINTIPVRIISESRQSFSQLAQMRHLHALQASSYEYLPLADIQAKTPLKNTLVDHIMVFENFPGQNKGSPTTNTKNTVEEMENFKSPEQSNYDFNVIVEPFRPIMVKFSYNEISYESSWVMHIAQHLKQVINQVADTPHISISNIEITPPKEKHRILNILNCPKTNELTHTGIQQRFEEQVFINQEKTAVSSPHETTDIFLPSTYFQKNPFIFEKKLEDVKGSTFILLKTHLHNCLVVNTNIIKVLQLFNGETDLHTLYSQLKVLENQNVTFIIYAPEVIDLLEITHNFQQKPEIISRMNYENFLYLVKLFYRTNLIQLAIPKSPTNKVEKVLKIKDIEKTENLADDTSLNELLKLKEYSSLTPVDILLMGDTPGMPSTGLLYLAAFLRRHGINASCRFHDSADNLSDMKLEIENLLEILQPKFIAISLKWFLYIARVKDMCRIIKEYAKKTNKSIKTVIGGDTASFYWEEIISDKNIDYIIRGDGEQPLLKLCRGENPSEIPNCVYKQKSDQKIIQNSITYINDNSNSRDIFLSHLQDILLAKYPPLFGTFFIYTHRGCNRNCIYCGGCQQVQKNSFNRKKGGVFTRPIQQIRQDIIAALPYVSTFQFDFDTAMEDMDKFCKQIWKNIDLTQHFCIISRYRRLSKTLLELAVKTFKYVYWDIDVLSLSQRHRQQLASMGIVKPQFTDKEIMNFLQQCDRYENIEVRFNLIAGLPYLNEDDLLKGDNFLSALIAGYQSLSELHWARLHAQPGAPLIAEADSYQMHSFATTYRDFLEYSEKNFAPASRHQQLEFLNYPYIYFNNDSLNSKITLNFTENNQKMRRYRERKRIGNKTAKILTYSQLNQKAEKLAHLLKEKGITTDKIVGIMLSPSKEIPLTILGVLKAGAGYMPIDPEFPPERAKFMLEDSGANILITTKELIENNKKINEWHGERIYIETFASPTPSLTEEKKNLTFSESNPETQLPPSTYLCYLIYTSGTTGKPKGVMLTHKNLLNYVQWCSEYMSISKKDNSLLTSSFAFDLGYTSLFPPLLNGGTLHIIPKEKYLSAEEILTYIRTNQVTYLKMTPSLFSVISRAPEFSPATCRQLRQVIIGGEPIQPGDIENAHQICPHLEIINHYGPTEATIGCIAQFS